MRVPSQRVTHRSQEGDVILLGRAFGVPHLRRGSLGLGPGSPTPAHNLTPWHRTRRRVRGASLTASGVARGLQARSVWPTGVDVGAQVSALVFRCFLRAGGCGHAAAREEQLGGVGEERATAGCPRWRLDAPRFRGELRSAQPRGAAEERRGTPRDFVGPGRPTRRRARGSAFSGS